LGREGAITKEEEGVQSFATAKATAAAAKTQVLCYVEFEH